MLPPESFRLVRVPGSGRHAAPRQVRVALQSGRYAHPEVRERRRGQRVGRRLRQGIHRLQLGLLDGWGNRDDAVGVGHLLPMQTRCGRGNLG
jgi:hypothetical protein